MMLKNIKDNNSLKEILCSSVFLSCTDGAVREFMRPVGLGNTLINQKIVNSNRSTLIINY
jgi:hypothetical protein